MAEGIAAIALTLAAPFVVALAIGMAGILLWMGRGRWMVITAAILAIVAQAFFRDFKIEFQLIDMVFMGLQLLAIVVAATCM
jgi:hypothetical protein